MARVVAGYLVVIVIVGSIMEVEVGLRGGFGTILPFEYWYSSSGS
jgi:hypothetical protein